MNQRIGRNNKHKNNEQYNRKTLKSRYKRTLFEQAVKQAKFWVIDSKNVEENKRLRLTTKNETLNITQEYNIYVHDNPQ